MKLIIPHSSIQSTLIMLASIFLSSCVGAVQMFQTVTPTPGKTFEPTFTPSPIPSSTPTSTPTPVPTPEPTQRTGPIATARLPLRLGKVEKIEEGGFSFRAPLGYELSYQRAQVTLTSDDGDTVVSLIGFLTGGSENLETDLERFAEIISATLEEFTTGSTFQFLVDGTPGLAAEVTGIYGENPVIGRIAVVAPNETQLFYALAISPDITTGEGWEPEGRQAFELMIRSITFHEIIIPQE
jgi:hypothetical protein